MPPPSAVSIVIPGHNQAQFLGAAIRSALEQTYRPAEVIIVDDGSTDDTASVASSMGVVLLRRMRGGVSAARNIGLAAASGRFIVFLDADDELMPTALEAGVREFAADSSADMIVRSCMLIDERGDVLPTNFEPPGDDLYGEWLGRNLVWTPGAAIFKREALAAIVGSRQTSGRRPTTRCI